MVSFELLFKLLPLVSTVSERYLKRFNSRIQIVPNVRNSKYYQAVNQSDKNLEIIYFLFVLSHVIFRVLLIRHVSFNNYNVSWLLKLIEM
jgi:hypothetical protein